MALGLLPAKVANGVCKGEHSLLWGGERRRWKEEGRLMLGWVSCVVTHA